MIKNHDPTWGSLSLENVMKLVLPVLHEECHSICLLLKSDLTRADKKGVMFDHIKGLLGSNDSPSRSFSQMAASA